jgi:hypothetical protein
MLEKTFLELAVTRYYQVEKDDNSQQLQRDNLYSSKGMTEWFSGV